MAKSPKKQPKKDKKQPAGNVYSGKSHKKDNKTLNQKPNGFKIFIMHFIAIISIAIFASLPLNKRWLDQRISKYLKIIPKQINNLDVETRKKNKWGFEYTITNFLKENLTSEDTLLLPPQTYLVSKTFRKTKTNHFWVRPRIFYYHSDGIIGVDMNTADSIIAKATHAVYVDKNNKIRMMKINTKQKLNRIVSIFDQYEMKIFWSVREAYKYYKKQKQ